MHKKLEALKTLRQALGYFEPHLNQDQPKESFWQSTIDTMMSYQPPDGEEETDE